VKHKGKRLYELAFKGQEVERQPRKIHISDIRITNYNLPDISFYMRCSKGTYVRQLAEDVARDLGSAGHIIQLQRQSVGPFTLEQASPLDQVDASKIQSFSD
jgi:tRNA pseudouridine55 synthase